MSSALSQVLSTSMSSTTTSGSSNIITSSLRVPASATLTVNLSITLPPAAANDTSVRSSNAVVFNNANNRNTASVTYPSHSGRLRSPPPSFLSRSSYRQQHRQQQFLNQPWNGNHISSQSSSIPRSNVVSGGLGYGAPPTLAMPPSQYVYREQKSSMAIGVGTRDDAIVIQSRAMSSATMRSNDTYFYGQYNTNNATQVVNAQSRSFPSAGNEHARPIYGPGYASRQLRAQPNFGSNSRAGRYQSTNPATNTSRTNHAITTPNQSHVRNNNYNLTPVNNQQLTIASSPNGVGNAQTMSTSLLSIGNQSIIAAETGDDGDAQSTAVTNNLQPISATDQSQQPVQAHQHVAVSASINTIQPLSHNRPSSRYSNQQHHQHNSVRNHHHLNNGANNLQSPPHQSPSYNRPFAYYTRISTRSDVLLDRKAFMSLEKSINWQSLITSSGDCNTTTSTTNTKGTGNDGGNASTEVSNVRDHSKHVVCSISTSTTSSSNSLSSSLTSSPLSMLEASTTSAQSISSSSSPNGHLSPHANNSLGTPAAAPVSNTNSSAIKEENDNIETTPTTMSGENNLQIDSNTTDSTPSEAIVMATGGDGKIGGGFNRPGMRDVPAWLKRKLSPLCLLFDIILVLRLSGWSALTDRVQTSNLKMSIILVLILMTLSISVCLSYNVC